MGNWIHHLWPFNSENFRTQLPWRLGSAGHKVLWTETLVDTRNTWWGRVANEKATGMEEAQCHLEGDDELMRKDRASFRPGSWACAYCSLCVLKNQRRSWNQDLHHFLLYLHWDSVHVAADLYLWALWIKRLALSQQSLTRAPAQFLYNLLIPLFLLQRRCPLLL